MNDKELKVLIFSLDNEMYATNIMEVERILGYEKPTVLPETPDFVQGVINYEENVLPVISLGKKFKLGEEKISENSKIIVVKRKENKFGIIVENVYEVRNIYSNSIEETPEITRNSDRCYISGLIKLKENIVIMLDLEKILSMEDESSIF